MMASNGKPRSSKNDDDREMENAGNEIHTQSLFERLTVEAKAALATSEYCTQESAHLKCSARTKHNKARDLERQANALNRKAYTLDANAAQAKDRARSLHFQSIQAGLESNNTAILVAVNSNECDGLRYPDGYGAALGQALSNNTVITDLELNLYNILSLKTRRAALVHQEIQSMLNFLARSTSLQRCTIRHEKTRPCALSENVALQLSKCVIQQLGESSSLRELSWHAKISAPALSSFMYKSYQTLERFSIDLELEEAKDFLERDDNCEEVAEAFGDHKVLQHLTLGGLRREYLMAMCILAELHRVKSLQCLRLVSWLPPEGERRGNMSRSISSYLQESSADGNTPLQRLEMDQFTFVEADMIELLQGLVRDELVGDDDNSPPVSSISVSSLCLTKCLWPSRSARNRLKDFLHRRTTNDEDDIVLDSNLRELHIGYNGSSLGRGFSRRLASSLLRKSGPSDSNTDGNIKLYPYPTVGSQLVILGLDHVDRAFFSYLSNRAHRARASRLQDLHLCGMSKEASVAFAEALPNLTMIRKLSLQQVAKDATKDILKGLKSNSSVVNVTTSATSGFDAAQERKIQAYCRRNQWFAVAQKHKMRAYCRRSQGYQPVPPATAAVAANRAPTARTRESITASKPTESLERLFVYPALLQVAQQVPSTQEEMLLRGLLSLGQGCGSLSSALRSPPRQNRNAKRSRPS